MTHEDDAAEYEDLLAELRRDLPPVEPLPEEARAATRAAFASRRDSALLADIAEDSADTPPLGLRDGPAFGVDDGSALGVGDGPGLVAGPRYVRFHAPGVAVRLEITPVDDRRDIVGELTPPSATHVDIRGPRGTTRHDIDPTGAFTAPNLPRGPLTLTFHRPNHPPVATQWTTI